jgi:ribosome-associated toxin RatA of RatAB toxin-antitoxin module
MASAEVSDVFACSVEQFYKIVTDYEKYPEFLQEVKECKILKAEGNKKLIEYKVSVMKDFKYSLWMTEAPTLISWEFASGDIFKTLKGLWKLQDENGKCRASYSLDATFGMLVPSPIAKALVSVNLPNMISSYHKRVAELYGR